MYKLNYLRHIDILGQEKPLVATLWHSPPLLPRETPYRQQFQHRLPVSCYLLLATYPVEELDPARDKSPTKGKNQLFHLLPGAQETVHWRHPVAERHARSRHRYRGATFFLDIVTETRLYGFMRTM